MSDKKKNSNNKPKVGKESKVFFFGLALAALDTAESGDLDHILKYCAQTKNPEVWMIFAAAAKDSFN